MLSFCAIYCDGNCCTLTTVGLNGGLVTKHSQLDKLQGTDAVCLHLFLIITVTNPVATNTEVM